MEEKKIVIALILFSAISTIGFSQHRSSELALADSLYDNFHESEALKRYSSVLESDPDHYLALWRSSFLYSRIGYRLEDEQKQLNYYDEAIQLARRALHVDSSDTQSNFVMAVAQGRKAMVSGARERVAASRSIKRYAEKVISIDSLHAGALHVLGRWHFKVANLSFLERAAANTLFGGIPEASEQQALRYLKKASRLKPNYILYAYDLARLQKHIGNEQKALKRCRTALKMEPLSPDDPELKQKCRSLINTIE